MHPPQWLCFFQRKFPSANMVLVRTERPLVFDTGFGSDLPDTENLLRDAGVAPERLHLIINSHYHSDHAGGNHGLQQRYGLPIAAHRWEAAMVNARDPEACTADWLVQPVESYRVNRPLSDGDIIDAGGVTLQVLHTPGHTLGHISLYAPEERVLLMGDAVHADDVAWVNPFREGAGAVHRHLDTLDRLSKLPVTWACSGHGPAITDPLAAIDAARRRYEKWLVDPQKLAWHAIKRIFAYALMLDGGLPTDGVAPYLLRCPWFHDFSGQFFQAEPADFVAPFLAEMLRSGAAARQAGRLVALTAHNPPPPGWLRTPGRPALWTD